MKLTKLYYYNIVICLWNEYIIQLCMILLINNRESEFLYLLIINFES